ncbi:competence protein ComFC [Marinilactibacillus piezotolerans]|uniref:Competence protein ComFC n=2 Tax=Carnobacteriaceae TaxID=186828 RepID=A0A1I3X1H2_9LACT|nr:competence protein ComFC [Marinilactibacillus piezotolerans]
MNKCVWCKREIITNFSISQLLTFTKIEPRVVCGTCALKFDTIKLDSCCPKCHRKQLDKSICQDCMNWQKIYPDYPFSHYALYSYDEFGKEWMERFKFTGDIRVAKMVADSLAKVISGYKAIDMIIPIPISKKSFARRGFNQTEILLKTAGVSFIQVLENKSIESNQASKNRRERLETVQPFSIKKEMKPKLCNKNVMIIDDVYTTGRTILFAVECVLAAGARNVKTLSLFR